MGRNTSGKQPKVFMLELIPKGLSSGIKKVFTKKEDLNKYKRKMEKTGKYKVRIIP